MSLKPFWFNNPQLNHIEVLHMLKGVGDPLAYLVRCMGFMLKKKLKVLKPYPKMLDKETYGNIDVKIELLVEEIKVVYRKCEGG